MITIGMSSLLWLIRRLEEYAKRIDSLIWTVLLVGHTRVRKELLLLYPSYHQFVVVRVYEMILPEFGKRYFIILLAL